jgi:hypothetical protein
MLGQPEVYFVWKKTCPFQGFRVVRREVKARTQKGYPIAFVLKSIPLEFDSWDKAQTMADELNQDINAGETSEWYEVEEQSLD